MVKVPRSVSYLSMNFKRHLIWVTILAVAVGFTVFGNSLNGRFVYDDNLVLSHDLFNQPSKFIGFFTEPYFDDYAQAGIYRPLTQMSFAFNFSFYNGSTIGFHLFNIFLHIVNSILVFYLISKIAGSLRLAWFSFALFLVLPVHVEAVASIVGRAELLVFFFSIVSIIFWQKSKYLLSALFFLAALLSKETAVGLILILAVLCLFHKVKFNKLWRHGLALAVYFLLRSKVLGNYVFAADTEFVFNPLKFSPFLERVATSFKIFVLYLQKILVPRDLSPDYSFNQIPIVSNIFTSPTALIGFLLFISTIFWIYKCLRKRQNPVLLSGLILFFGPYLVVSNLIFPIGTIMADRLMYLPSLGIVSLISLVLEYISKKNFHRPVIFSVIILTASYSIASIFQNQVWASEQNLFLSMYLRSPESVVAKTKWAETIFSANPKEAARLSQEAYSLYPNFVPNLNLSAALKIEERKINEAIPFLEKALELKPNHQQTLTNLSRLYFTLKKYHEAGILLEKLVSIYGGKGNIILYAITLVRLSDYDGAIKLLEQKFLGLTGDTAKGVADYANLKLKRPGKNKSFNPPAGGSGSVASDIEKRFLEIEESFIIKATP